MSLLDGYAKSLFHSVGPRNCILSRLQNKVFFQGLLFIETAGKESHILIIVIIIKIQVPLFLGVFLI